MDASRRSDLKFDLNNYYSNERFLVKLYNISNEKILEKEIGSFMDKLDQQKGHKWKAYDGQSLLMADI